MTDTDVGCAAGRAIIVVGGTSGIGHAAAIELGRAGNRIVLIGRRSDRAGLAAQAVSETTGCAAHGIGTDGAPLGSAIDRAAALMGGLDGLAVTAGPMGAVGGFSELTDEDWAESFETQVMTVVRACRAALPHLQRRGGSRIVTVAAYSIRAQKPFLAHYAAMKSAVASLTKNIAKSYGAHGIGANCIAPGAIDTEALDDVAGEAMSLYGVEREPALARFMSEKWGMNVALGRPGRKQEVAALIAFLLSPQSAYITGALINIDGGTDF
jgi:NAD(P)-dependent dehydrogenase (short-subunit alcohol dehydrogenase family)